MMKKFLLAFGGMLLFIAFWGVIMVLGTILLFVNGTLGGIVLAIAALGSVVGLIPFMQWMVGFIFNFPADDVPPASEAQLRAEILKINGPDSPILVEERDRKLVATWNHRDVEWWGILSQSGMHQIYELQIKFDEKNHTATFIDVNKSVKWETAPSEVQIYGGFSRGVDIFYQREIEYGWNDEGQFEREDFEFKNTDIKNPLMNLFVTNGWRVKFGMW